MEEREEKEDMWLIFQNKGFRVDFILINDHFTMQRLFYLQVQLLRSLYLVHCSFPVEDE